MSSKKQLSSFPKIVTTPSINFLEDMASIAENEICIFSPWIKQNTLKKIYAKSKPGVHWKVVARGNIEDFLQGSSDIEAFRFIVEHLWFSLTGRRKRGDKEGVM
jgi:hypothetical protein